MLGILIGLFFMYVLNSNFSDRFVDNFFNLTSILFVFLGAGLATFGVLISLNQTETTRQQERQSRLKANRALLTPILSEISQAADLNCRIFLAKSRANRDANENLNTPRDELSEYASQEILLVQPFISGEYFQIYRDCIELADDTSRNWLIAISNSYQLASARTSRSDDIALEVDPDDFDICTAYSICTDWLLVRNLTNHCFEYARGRSDEIQELIPLTEIYAGLRKEKMNFSSPPIAEYKNLNDVFRRVSSRLLVGEEYHNQLHPEHFISLLTLREKRWVDF